MSFRESRPRAFLVKLAFRLPVAAGRIRSAFHKEFLRRGGPLYLPAGTEFGNTSTVIQQQSSNPSPREGVATLPYTGFSFYDDGTKIAGGHIRSAFHKEFPRRGGPPCPPAVFGCPMAIQITKTPL